MDGEELRQSLEKMASWGSAPPADPFEAVHLAREVGEHFAFLWGEYATETDANMTGDAIALANAVRVLFGVAATPPLAASKDGEELGGEALSPAFVLACGFTRDPDDPDDPDRFAAPPHPEVGYPQTGVVLTADGRWWAEGLCADGFGGDGAYGICELHSRRDFRDLCRLRGVSLTTSPSLGGGSAAPATGGSPKRETFEELLAHIRMRAEEHRAKYPAFKLERFMHWVSHPDGPCRATLRRHRDDIAHLNRRVEGRGIFTRTFDD